MTRNPRSDPILATAPLMHGYRVLTPCVLFGRLGEGAMGSVFRATHLNLDIQVAVKCLKPELVQSDDQFVKRFQREARLAAKINHQNVVRVFDVGHHRGLHYLIMELVTGETARRRVERVGRMPVVEAVEILRGAACGLAAAHERGITHRDIKPENILISEDGVVKLADLGLAKPLSKEEEGTQQLSTAKHIVMGTPAYMPPEQWLSAKGCVPATDVWALGATLYFLLCGTPPIRASSRSELQLLVSVFPFPDPRHVRPDVPNEVAELIARATCHDPEDRFRDGRALLEAIDKLPLPRTPLAAFPAGTATPVPSPDLAPTRQIRKRIRTKITSHTGVGPFAPTRWLPVALIAVAVAGGGILWKLRQEIPAEAAVSADPDDLTSATSPPERVRPLIVQKIIEYGTVRPAQSLLENAYAVQMALEGAANHPGGAMGSVREYRQDLESAPFAYLWLLLGAAMSPKTSALEQALALGEELSLGDSWSQWAAEWTERDPIANRAAKLSNALAATPYIAAAYDTQLCKRLEELDQNAESAALFELLVRIPLGTPSSPPQTAEWVQKRIARWTGQEHFSRLKERAPTLVEQALRDEIVQRSRANGPMPSSHELRAWCGALNDGTFAASRIAFELVACALGNDWTQVVSALLAEEKIGPQLARERDERHATLLHLAVRQRDGLAVERLVERGADLDAVTLDGNSVFGEWLQAGADPFLLDQLLDLRNPKPLSARDGTGPASLLRRLATLGAERAPSFLRVFEFTRVHAPGPQDPAAEVWRLWTNALRDDAPGNLLRAQFLVQLLEIDDGSEFAACLDAGLPDPGVWFAITAEDKRLLDELLSHQSFLHEHADRFRNACTQLAESLEQNGWPAHTPTFGLGAFERWGPTLEELADGPRLNRALLRPMALSTRKERWKTLGPGILDAAAALDDHLVLELLDAWEPTSEELKLYLWHPLPSGGTPVSRSRDRGADPFTAATVLERAARLVASEWVKEFQIHHKGYRWELRSADSESREGILLVHGPPVSNDLRWTHNAWLSSVGEITLAFVPSDDSEWPALQLGGDRLPLDLYWDRDPSAFRSGRIRPEPWDDPTARDFLWELEHGRSVLFQQLP